MPTLAKRIERFFLGDYDHDAKDRELAFYRSQIAQNTQVSQSGARVIDHMSNVMKLMADAHVKQ